MSIFLHLFLETDTIQCSPVRNASILQRKTRVNFHLHSLKQMRSAMNSTRNEHFWGCCFYYHCSDKGWYILNGPLKNQAHKSLQACGVGTNTVTWYSIQFFHSFEIQISTIVLIPNKSKCLPVSTVLIWPTFLVVNLSQQTMFASSTSSNLVLYKGFRIAFNYALHNSSIALPDYTTIITIICHHHK